jgi:hypothetical protein
MYLGIFESHLTYHRQVDWLALTVVEYIWGDESYEVSLLSLISVKIVSTMIEYIGNNKSVRQFRNKAKAKYARIF